MRILITASTFPLELQRGSQRFVYDLAQALSARAQVTALVPAHPGAPARERMGDVDVRRFTYFWPAGRQCLAYGTSMVDSMRESAWARVQVPTLVAAQVWALRRLLRQERFDVVNSHWMVPQGLSAAVVRRVAPPFAHVLSVHAGDVYLLNKLPGGRRIAQAVMRRTDATFADGSHVRDTLDRLLTRPSDAIIQPMGAHRSVFASGEPIASRFADSFLLFVGRFAEKKGVSYLLRAMPRILAQRPGLGLVLIGYGTLENALRDEAAQLGISGSVEFTGRCTHEQIVRYLHACRLAVVPSIIDSRGETEGMPTVVIEAMAAGVPVVGSAVDGIPDIIRHGENGWLCREKDPEHLAETILAALDQSDDQRIRRAAAQTAEQHDWPRVAERYMEVFERLVPMRGAAA